MTTAVALVCAFTAAFNPLFGDPRERLTLDGDWNFLPVYADELIHPPTGEWAMNTIRVPSVWTRSKHARDGEGSVCDAFAYPPSWSAARRAWYRRGFTLPEHWLGSRVYLRLNGALHRAHVYVNDQYYGSSDDGLLPAEFDITPVLSQPGPHTLLIGVEEAETNERGQALAPIGPQWAAENLGLWQSVFVQRRPAARVERVAIATSLRTRMLEADVLVANDSVTATTLTLHGRVYPAEAVPAATEESTPLLTLPSVTVALLPGATAETMLAAFWSDPVIWWPHDPRLLALVVEVERGFRVTDRVVERFGFREIEQDGLGLRLNGVPLRLRGDCWPWVGPAQQHRDYARLGYTMARDTGVNVIRLHGMPFPSFYHELADELGMLLIAESAVYDSAGRVAKDSPVFWERARRHVAAMARRDRGHPSVIAWSASHELSRAWGREGEAYYDDQWTLYGALRRNDPSRPIFFAGDWDLGGRAPIMSGHFLLWPHWQRIWRRDKPLVISAFGDLGRGDAKTAAWLGGNEPYASFEASLEAAGRGVRCFMDGARRDGAACTAPWTILWHALEPLAMEDAAPPATTPGSDTPQLDFISRWSLTLNPGWSPSEPRWQPNAAYPAIRQALAPVYAQLTWPGEHVYSDAPGALELTIYNDTLQPATLEARLRADALGLEWSAGAALPAGGRQTWSVPLEGIRPVERATAAALALTINDAATGVVLDAATRDWTWHPPARARPALRLTRAARVWDPSGFAAQALASLGVAASPATAEAALTGGELVVLGAELVLAATEAATIERFLRAGGRVVCLSQSEAPPWIALELRSTGLRAGPVFVRDASHPLAAELDDSMLRDWHPNGEVTAGLYRKPTAGPFRVVLDAGTSEGLWGAALLEVRQGRGLALLCQLDLPAAWDRHPAARLVLERLLTYADGWTPPGAPPCAMDESAPDGELARLLTRMGVELDTAPDRAALLFADAAGLDASGAQRLRARAADGALVFVHAPHGMSDDLAAILCGGPARWVEQPVRHLVTAGASPWLRGVSNDEFYWVRLSHRPVARFLLSGVAAEHTPLLTTPPVDWESWSSAENTDWTRAAAVRRKPQTFVLPAAALIELPVGAGQLLLSSVLWDHAAGGRTALAQLLANLGLAVGPPRARHRVIIHAGRETPGERWLGRGWNSEAVRMPAPVSLPWYEGAETWRAMDATAELRVTLPPAPAYRVAVSARLRASGTLALRAGERELTAWSEPAPALKVLRGGWSMPAGDTASGGGLVLVWRGGEPPELSAIDIAAAGYDADSPGEFIRSWLVAGPFPGADLDHEQLPAEARLRPAAGMPVFGGAWRPWHFERDILDLEAARPGWARRTDSTLYAAVYLTPPLETNAAEGRGETYDLWVGSAGGIKVWLNEQLVHVNDVVRSLGEDQDAITGLRLLPGKNRLLFKLSQRGGGAGWCARLTRSAGAPATEVALSLLAEEE